jgi:hypothetical protein
MIKARSGPGLVWVKIGSMPGQIALFVYNIKLTNSSYFYTN